MGGATIYCKYVNYINYMLALGYYGTEVYDISMTFRNVPIVPNGTERQTTLRKKFVTVGINAE